MIIKTSKKTGPRVLDSQSLVDEYAARELSRRRMLQSVMAASTAAMFGAACTSTSGDSGQPSGPAAGSSSSSSSSGSTGENPNPGDTPTPGGGSRGTHLVGMGYDENDREAALKAALEETLGLSKIKAGESVYLRVNSNSGDVYPYSTSPDTILTIGGMLKDLGVTDLRIGDRSFWGDQNTAGNLKSNGITGAAQKLGTKAVVYDDAVDWVNLPASMVPNWKGDIRLPEPVTTADHMIILSVVKTHFISTITMSLKIALGLVHATDRARAGNLQNHDTKVLFKQIAQINQAFTPSLIINDGYSAVISGGPTKRDKPSGAPSSFTGGITADPKLFIVSADRVAADVAGIAVLQGLSPSYEAVTKTAPFENPVIAAAVAANLGIKNAAAFDVGGKTVPNLAEILARVTG